MRAKKMLELAERKQRQRQERIKRRIERKNPTIFSKVYYLYMILRIKVRALNRGRNLTIYRELSHWAEMKLKDEGFSVCSMYNKMGNVMYTVIAW